MRVITGSARGRRLDTLPGTETRPTAEKVKEALFSAIQFEIEGRQVLDLFAGSGQLGLEAISRGATRATFVDASKEAAAIIGKNIEKTHFADACRVVSSDVAAFLRSDAGQYDLVFVDPPYAAGLTKGTLALLVSGGKLAPGAIVVAETGEERDVFGDDAALASHFTVTKRVRYGKAAVAFLTFPGGGDTP